MAEGTNPYVNECGACLFDLALDLYDGWMEGLPYVHCGRDGVVVAECQPELVRDVWPTVQQLCVRLEAQGKGDLAARLERAFRDAEDYARLIDNYCQSERFDYHLWAYGDVALDGLHYPEADLETLEAKAREIGEGPLTEDLAFWEHEREWALHVGERAWPRRKSQRGLPRNSMRRKSPTRRAPALRSTTASSTSRAATG